MPEMFGEDFSLPPLLDDEVQGRLDIIFMLPVLMPPILDDYSLEFKFQWWGHDKPQIICLNCGDDEAKISYDVRSDLKSLKNYLSDAEDLTVDIFRSASRKSSKNDNNSKNSGKKYSKSNFDNKGNKIVENDSNKENFADGKDKILKYIGTFVIYNLGLNSKGENVSESIVYNERGERCGTVVSFMLYTETIFCTIKNRVKSILKPDSKKKELILNPFKNDDPPMVPEFLNIEIAVKNEKDAKMSTKIVSDIEHTKNVLIANSDQLFVAENVQLSTPPRKLSTPPSELLTPPKAFLKRTSKTDLSPRFIPLNYENKIQTPEKIKSKPLSQKPLIKPKLPTPQKLFKPTITSRNSKVSVQNSPVKVNRRIISNRPVNTTARRALKEVKVQPTDNISNKKPADAANKRLETRNEERVKTKTAQLERQHPKNRVNEKTEADESNKTHGRDIQKSNINSSTFSEFNIDDSTNNNLLLAKLFAFVDSGAILPSELPELIQICQGRSSFEFSEMKSSEIENFAIYPKNSENVLENPDFLHPCLDKNDQAFDENRKYGSVGVQSRSFNGLKKCVNFSGVSEIISPITSEISLDNFELKQKNNLNEPKERMIRNKINLFPQNRQKIDPKRNEVNNIKEKQVKSSDKIFDEEFIKSISTAQLHGNNNTVNFQNKIQKKKENENNPKFKKIDTITNPIGNKPTSHKSKHITNSIFISNEINSEILQETFPNEPRLPDISRTFSPNIKKKSTNKFQEFSESLPYRENTSESCSLLLLSFSSILLNSDLDENHMRTIKKKTKGAEVRQRSKMCYFVQVTLNDDNTQRALYVSRTVHNNCVVFDSGKIFKLGHCEFESRATLSFIISRRRLGNRLREPIGTGLISLQKLLDKKRSDLRLILNLKPVPSNLGNNHATPVESRRLSKHLEASRALPKNLDFKPDPNCSITFNVAFALNENHLINFLPKKNDALEYAQCISDLYNECESYLPEKENDLEKVKNVDSDFCSQKLKENIDLGKNRPENGEEKFSTDKCVENVDSNKSSSQKYKGNIDLEKRHEKSDEISSDELNRKQNVISIQRHKELIELTKNSSYDNQEILPKYLLTQTPKPQEDFTGITLKPLYAFSKQTCQKVQLTPKNYHEAELTPKNTYENRNKYQKTYHEIVRTPEHFHTSESQFLESNNIIRESQNTDSTVSKRSLKSPDKLSIANDTSPITPSTLHRQNVLPSTQIITSSSYKNSSSPSKSSKSTTQDIHIEILEADSLPMMKIRHINRRIYPSCYVTIDLPSIQVRTAVVRGTCSPKWNFVDSIQIDQEELEKTHMHLVFKIYHCVAASPSDRDAFIGFATIDSRFLWTTFSSQCGWVPIQNLNDEIAGEIKVSVTPKRRLSYQNQPRKEMMSLVAEFSEIEQNFTNRSPDNKLIANQSRDNKLISHSPDSKIIADDSPENEIAAYHDNASYSSSNLEDNNVTTECTSQKIKNRSNDFEFLNTTQFCDNENGGLNLSLPEHLIRKYNQSLLEDSNSDAMSSVHETQTEADSSVHKAQTEADSSVHEAQTEADSSVHEAQTEVHEVQTEAMPSCHQAQTESLYSVHEFQTDAMSSDHDNSFFVVENEEENVDLNKTFDVVQPKFSHKNNSSFIKNEKESIKKNILAIKNLSDGFKQKTGEFTSRDASTSSEKISGDRNFILEGMQWMNRADNFETPCVSYIDTYSPKRIPMYPYSAKKGSQFPVSPREGTNLPRVYFLNSESGQNFSSNLNNESSRVRAGAFTEQNDSPNESFETDENSEISKNNFSPENSETSTNSFSHSAISGNYANESFQSSEGFRSPVRVIPKNNVNKSFETDESVDNVNPKNEIANVSSGINDVIEVSNANSETNNDELSNVGFKSGVNSKNNKSVKSEKIASFSNLSSTSLKGSYTSLQKIFKSPTKGKNVKRSASLKSSGEKSRWKCRLAAKFDKIFK